MRNIYNYTELRRRYSFCLFLGVILFVFGCGEQKAQQDNIQQSGISSSEANELAESEPIADWKFLFDGKTTAGWRGINQENFPSEGWKIEKGMLWSNSTDGKESGNGGDIITIEQFDDFVLDWEWKMITRGGNSGVKYFVKEGLSDNEKYGVGLEYQILDDENHPWMLEGKMQPNDYYTLASLYEIYPAKNKSPEPLGEWNHSRIVVKGNKVEHWLNNRIVVQYERGNEDFRKRVAESKFSKFKNFGEAEQGHILLQDHGGKVAFRNIKIKEFE
ncbi:3-keto-disaccharide hydrolase [Autumnicola edwardsiae]|uniref:DUF1080 domain-containing protein n=1 Tax=Autumnicola edwardsiae TaxID=3075594 RepID=A0ABU3CXL7_9FLAO|nr:DUF1080 domain-containing protein [Zunongwangia sp. F297]MDT0650635.1 DUF1080 domain-containing protein [Zunongwangia sp. F297]